MPEISTEEIITELKAEIKMFTQNDSYFEPATEEDIQTLIIKEFENKARCVVVSFNSFLGYLPIDSRISYLEPILPTFSLDGSLHKEEFGFYMQQAFSVSPRSTFPKENMMFLLKRCKTFLVNHPEGNI